MLTTRMFSFRSTASADRYLARPDGAVEWLNRRPRTVDYGMRAFYPTIDTILWGRKTYDWLINYYKKKGKKAGNVRHQARELRILAQASKTGGTRRRICIRASESVCAASESDT